MTPYLFTVFFLMMISFLTSSEVARFAQSRLEKGWSRTSSTLLAAAEEVRELSHLEMLRGEKKETEDSPAKEKEEVVDKSLQKAHSYVKRAKALGISGARPPNNSRLNFYALLHTKSGKKKAGDFSLYDTLSRVMDALYRDEVFFNEIDNAGRRVLDKLIEKKELCLALTSPDHLTNVDLEDEVLQKILYHMLKGTKNAPSLLNYITLDPFEEGNKKQARKINLLFADALIIEAIFPEGETAAKILSERERIWKKIAYQEEHRLEMPPEQYLGRGAFSEELKSSLEAILTMDGYNAKKYKNMVFDCTLGSPGTILFLEDPLSDRVIREPYVPLN